MGVAQMTNHPLWMLMPWAIFASAALIKFWRVTTLYRRHHWGTPSCTETFRQILEQNWEKGQ